MKWKVPIPMLSTAEIARIALKWRMMLGCHGSRAAGREQAGSEGGPGSGQRVARGKHCMCLTLRTVLLASAVLTFFLSKINKLQTKYFTDSI